MNVLELCSGFNLEYQLAFYYEISTPNSNFVTLVINFTLYFPRKFNSQLTEFYCQCSLVQDLLKSGA